MAILHTQHFFKYTLGASFGHRIWVNWTLTVECLEQWGNIPTCREYSKFANTQAIASDQDVHAGCSEGSAGF